MTHYDLCLTWYSEYDADFVGALASACAARSVSLWQVGPPNLLAAVGALYGGQISFGVLLDRAADDLRFAPFVRWARDRGAGRINPAETSAWAEDKATMHLELISAGIHTPYTIILAPFVDEPVMFPPDLAPLGGRFVIKPAYGGGGEGVILTASTLQEVLAARTEFPDQKYLLQEHIAPRMLDGRPAWFRVIVCDGELFPCWWDPRTHVYSPLTAEAESHFELGPLREVARRVARICRLDLFSTEVAWALDGRWVAVDYVNDNIDLRVQSKAADGVPDQIIRGVADRLAQLAARQNVKAASAGDAHAE